MASHQQHCTPCEGGAPALSAVEAEHFAAMVPGWTIQDQTRRLVRPFKFPDFASSLEFVNAIGMIAEAEGHHPDICFGWGYVTVSLYTHAISGLHKNDFLIAEKINNISFVPITDTGALS